MFTTRKTLLQHESSSLVFLVFYSLRGASKKVGETMAIEKQISSSTLEGLLSTFIYIYLIMFAYINYL